MGIPREKLIASGLAGILVIQVTYLGWLWYKSKSLAGRAEVIIQAGSGDTGVTVKKAELQKAISYLRLMRQPDRILVNIYTTTPKLTDENVAFFTPDAMTRSGFGIKGIICSKPRSSEKLDETTIDFYYIPKDISDRAGRDEAKKKINDMFLQCVLYAVSYNELNKADFTKKI
jgi:hypothetical protein